MSLSAGPATCPDRAESLRVGLTARGLGHPSPTSQVRGVERDTHKYTHTHTHTHTHHHPTIQSSHIHHASPDAKLEKLPTSSPHVSLGSVTT
jgi:hypothetical protein